MVVALLPQGATQSPVANRSWRMPLATSWKGTEALAQPSKSYSPYFLSPEQSHGWDMATGFERYRASHPCLYIHVSTRSLPGIVSPPPSCREEHVRGQWGRCGVWEEEALHLVTWRESPVKVIKGGGPSGNLWGMPLQVGVLPGAPENSVCHHSRFSIWKQLADPCLPFGEKYLS